MHGAGVVAAAVAAAMLLLGQAGAGRPAKLAAQLRVRRAVAVEALGKAVWCGCLQPGCCQGARIRKGLRVGRQVLIHRRRVLAADSDTAVAIVVDLPWRGLRWKGRRRNHRWQFRRGLQHHHLVGNLAGL